MISARATMIVVALITTGCLLALNTPQAWAQETPASDDEDSSLLNEAIQLLEDADLRSLLEDRQLLQDIGDLQEKLPDKDAVINEAQKRLLDLQASGQIPSEEIKEAAKAVLDHPSQDLTVASSGSDVLGPEPKKAPRKLDEAAAEKTINFKTYGGMHMDYKKRVMVFEEDVVVTDDEFEIQCDLLDVHLDETDQLERAIATGKMVIINGKDSEGNPMEARCQRAIYDGHSIVLRGWPEISNGGRTIKAKSAKTVMGFDIEENDELKPWVDGPIDGDLKKPAEKKP